ncbi:hypothetical protein J437_LFUL011980 [Ladona fulva]|uniref:Peptidase S1 domain-containing protein n=1 Tax=Ladona fulva TaxID=123851 RepID=A0A8K0KJ99_LADFU|nr:hypothetical protein J437_LFUL011980 [Ladona fulva]
MKTVIVLLSLIAIIQASSLKLRSLKPVHNEKVFGSNEDSSEDLFITGGDIAKRGQFPWTVFINIDNNYICGGALISSRWVLTAAECTYGFGLFQLYIGMQNMDDDEVGRLVVITTNRIAHEEYDYNDFKNDISLIKLNHEVGMNDYIATVSLPTYSMASNDYAGDTAIALGWGLTSDNDTQVNRDLRFVNLTVISNIACKDSWGNYILDGNICTDATTMKSTCSGDNGGPLVTADNILIGIQSFVATDGCQKGLSSVFTRVTHYLQWIETSSGIKIDP